MQDLTPSPPTRRAASLQSVLARILATCWIALAVVAVPAAALEPNPIANIADAADDNGTSFTRQPTDLIHLDVLWDGSALTVKLTYARTPPAYELTLLISDSAATDPSAEACAANEADSIEINATPDGQATLTMPYIDGELPAQASPADATITYFFAHQALADAIKRGRDPFTCLSGNADGDHFYGSFNGRYLRITTESATVALTTALTNKYAARFTTAPRKWVKCPKVEIFPATDDMSPSALCAFEFGRAGATYRGGTTQVVLVSGQLDATSYLRSRTYTKTMQNCHIPTTKTGWVNGAYLTDRTLRNSASLGDQRGCKQLVGPAGMAADLEYPVVTRPSPSLRSVVAYTHGTNTAGFGDQTRYPCRATRQGTRYHFDCKNLLGDRFIYSFTLRRR